MPVTSYACAFHIFLCDDLELLPFHLQYIITFCDIVGGGNTLLLSMGKRKKDHNDQSTNQHH